MNHLLVFMLGALLGASAIDSFPQLGRYLPIPPSLRHADSGQDNGGTQRGGEESTAKATADFPETGTTRWFVANAAGVKGPAKLHGASDKNLVVRFESWETRQPVVLVAVRAKETTEISLPLGSYRVVFARSSNGLFNIGQDAQEGTKPVDFYVQGNNIIGHTLDFAGRINGNFTTRRASKPGTFSMQDDISLR